MEHTKSFGFTMIELLVATVIIAVLTAVGVTSYASATRKSRDTKRISDIEQMRSALEMYRSDNGFYPNTGAGWLDIGGVTGGDFYTALVSGGYMQAIPDDPKNTSASPTYTYFYQPANLVNGQYYGYYLSAKLENTPSGTQPCSPNTGDNYCQKNP